MGGMTDTVISNFSVLPAMASCAVFLLKIHPYLVRPSISHNLLSHLNTSGL